MKAKASKTFSTVFITLLLLLLLSGVIGFIVYFSNNLTTGLKTFYVHYGKTEYSQSANGLALESGVYHNFDCKYLLGFPQGETAERYSVKITPNPDVPYFDFKVDGERYLFNAEKDLSSGFTLLRYKDGFSVFIPRNLTMQAVLESVYNGKTVTNVPEINLAEKDYFNLVIMSYNGVSTINLGFRLKELSYEYKSN